MGKKTTVKSAGKQQLWETNWSAADYSPPWLTDEPPEELRRAVLARALPARARVLDIGCGNGAIAAWLAGQDFSVLGVDFSQSAIKMAKQRFADIPNLGFETVDVCRQNADIGKFDGLFDRGCLHTIPPRFAGQYAANVANWSRQNSLFLLIHKTPAPNNEPVSYAQRRARSYLGKLFKPWFSLKGVQPTVIKGSSGKRQNWEMPCLAIWMARK